MCQRLFSINVFKIYKWNTRLYVSHTNDQTLKKIFFMHSKLSNTLSCTTMKSRLYE